MWNVIQQRKMTLSSATWMALWSELRARLYHHCAGDAIKQLHLLENIFLSFFGRRLHTQHSAQHGSGNCEIEYCCRRVSGMIDERTSADPLCTSNYLMHPAKSPVESHFAPDRNCILRNAIKMLFSRNIAILRIPLDNKEYPGEKSTSSTFAERLLWR